MPVTHQRSIGVWVRFEKWLTKIGNPISYPAAPRMGNRPSYPMKSSPWRSRTVMPGTKAS